MKRLIMALFLAALALMVIPAVGQDVTPTPEKLDFPFSFPLSMPTEAQIQEAFHCALNRESPEVTPTPSAPHKPSGCELAQQLLALAGARTGDQPSDAELALFTKMMSANPALAFDLSIISKYYNALPLVAPPDFASQPITALNIRYIFGGLGGSADYTITIADADKTPVVSGTADASNDFSQATGTPPTHAPRELSGTVDSTVVQDFGAALRDLIPIGKQFTSTPCWDYYPDWIVDLTFADGKTISMVTNQSNVVGIGGPWQTEIDGQNYMQYSGAFANAISALFDALKLEFGQTAAMGCGGVSNPLTDAFEVKGAG